MPRPFRVNPLAALWLLFRMQLLSMRWFWRATLVGGFFLPLFTLAFWKLLVAGYGARTSDAIYFLSGNVVISLLFGNMREVASRFAFLQETAGLDYYATLMTDKVSLILAVVLAFLVMSLPGALFALLIGTAWLGAPIQPHPLLALALVLGSIALSVLGAIVGVYCRSQEQSSIIITLLTLGLAVLSPVMAPIERLPKILQATSYLTPTTYATQAVRSALVSTLDGRFWLNLAVLVLFCLAALAFVSRRLDWRA